MNVVVVSPIATSLYSLLVAEQVAREPGVVVTGVLLRRVLNPRRLRKEFARDGVRLLRKVYQKLIVAPTVPRCAPPPADSLSGLRDRCNLRQTSITDWVKVRKVPLCRVFDLNEPAALAFLRRCRADVVCFTGGGLLRSEFLGAAGAGVLNVHVGILPFYRGMDVVEWPWAWPGVEHGQTGATLHVMNAGLDTGPILQVLPFDRRRGESFLAFRERLAPRQVELQLAGVRAIRDGAAVPPPQSTEDGLQFYVMHPRMRLLAESVFTDISLSRS